MPRTTALAALALCVLGPCTGWAHHSIAHDFDVGQRVRLEGKVLQFRWMNPHCALRLAVPRVDGRIDVWEIEGGPPNALLRKGWTRQTLREGQQVVVSGYPARDGSRRANAQSITLPDGQVLDAASSYLPPRR